MSRWQPNARHRLEQAALELFAEKGFSATTVPEITARAGLTTRTFFRHFRDKREVIFGGEEMYERAAELLVELPASDGPAALIGDGLSAIAEARFEGRRAEIRQRRGIIARDDALRERDLRKRAALCEALRTGFVRRGIGALPARLLAETSVTVLYTAVDEWLARDDDRPLSDLIRETLDALRTSIE
ncbi:TetR/AcrR family transcriptional regulator [Allonocardiopsis opalescens]|uniref:TetR family transcriptional regulator n=1 Tax=Allonocardiopsis opalescens TaxID=1144618 RepID=A0A2T0Q727_9ACTN|nr:TetR/AcrR family transcriptional regulator [Allonocardiopsis opalescens]PRX99629.1 TetR family transcriptional regulator [Allonocardiopsis opalescens]